MDFNKLTEKSQEAFQSAHSLGVQYGQSEVDTDHLLLALCTQADGLIPRILFKA